MAAPKRLGTKKFKYDPLRGGHERFSLLFKYMRNPIKLECYKESMEICINIKKNCEYLREEYGWTKEALYTIMDHNGLKGRKSTYHYMGKEPGFKTIELVDVIVFSKIFEVHPIDMMFTDLQAAGYLPDRLRKKRGLPLNGQESEID